MRFLGSSLLTTPLTFFETFGDAVILTREEAKAYVQNQER